MSLQWSEVHVHACVYTCIFTECKGCTFFRWPPHHSPSRAGPSEGLQCLRDEHRPGEDPYRLVEVLEKRGERGREREEMWWGGGGGGGGRRL